LKESKHNCNNIEALEADYLYIATSQLPNSGNGLYTAIDIYKCEVISLFKGEIATSKHVVLRVKNDKDQYFISTLDGIIMDPMKEKFFAKHANGFSKPKFKNFEKIASDEENQVCIIAKKNIKVGEEIFCGYGKNI
jgi:hypothetical protein